MALRSHAFADNAPGSFFVERSRIDCGTCYELVGEVFGAADGHARVRRQPRDTVRGGVAMLVLSHRDDVADHAAIPTALRLHAHDASCRELERGLRRLRTL